MDLATMRSEVQARGFSHVTTSLVDRWINLTYQDVNNRFPWPYLEASTSGTAPITIADLGRVLYVADTTDKIPLIHKDIRDIVQDDPGLALTGNPRFWYWDGTTTNKIQAYPTGVANTITVRYTKVASDLGSDGSVPLLPTAFHYILVEGACARCYRRANEQAAAADAMQEVESGIAKMHNLLIQQTYDPPDPGLPVAPNYAGEPAEAQAPAPQAPTKQE